MFFFLTVLTSFLTLSEELLSLESNRVVLVTGGAGYIGSHACKALKEAGYVPVTYDSLKLGDRDLVKWGPLVIGDLLDHKALDQAFEKYQPCAVFHFAALRNVGESVRDPSSYYLNNVVGSLNLLNTMVKYGVVPIIFASSCTVYGDNSVIPIVEEQPKDPTNPYARSKHAVENMIIDYADAYQLKYMILRYFNVAGVDTEAGLRRSPHSYNFLIPAVMQALLSSRNSIPVFGHDYPTRDGTCVRDYIHPKDIACAHLLALHHLEEGKPSDEINLGTGNGYSVLEILNHIEKVSGQSVIYELQSRREGDMPEAVAKVEKAKEILGFETQFSDLHTMIESEWNSIQAQLLNQ